MRVQYDFTDKAGDSYTIDAEVHPVNHQKIQIISISGENADLSMDDFETDEQRDILWGAKEAAEELDKMDDEEQDDFDEDETNLEDY